MPDRNQAYRLMPWAWCAAWMLAGLGIAIGEIYSLPSRSVIAYIALGMAGWAVAGTVTAIAAEGASGMAVRWAAWAGADLVAIPLGLAWMLSRDMIPFLLFVPVGVAGTIGGAVSSLRAGAWRLASGALLGLVFFLLATVSFYGSYILIAFYTLSAALLGELGAEIVAWGLPGAACGLAAGFAARSILGLKAVAATSNSA